MSSELPLDRLGLSNSFETRTSQASDSPNEQRNEDVKGPDSSEKPQSGVDHGSDEKEGKVKAIGPEAFEKGGRVFVANVGKAEFSYVIPKGDEISLTLVLYHENGTAQDLGPSGLNANPDSGKLITVHSCYALSKFAYPILTDLKQRKTAHAIST